VDTDRARTTIATEAPRRLRLDEMLRELGARNEESEAPRREGIPLGELIDNAAESGFGFLVGVLALVAIPFFGLSTPFGLAIALVSCQLAFGRARPWMPNRLRKRVLAMTMLDRILHLLTRRTRWLAKSTRSRWEPLITPKLVGLAITLLGLGLALPLPIPGSNMVFLVPIIVYSIGLLERDGMWILIGHVMTFIDLVLTVAFGATIVAVFERLWHWLT
jgi:hypothetical protein